MSRLPFVDTHIHLFDMHEPGLRYSWLEPDSPEEPPNGPLGAIKAQRYWAEDFIAETRFQNVTKVVHVQAAIDTADPVLETRWLQAFADRLGLPQGIVAQLTLTADDAAEQLARHAEYPNLRGFRDYRFDDYWPDPRWETGVELLARHGGLVLCDAPPLEHAALARDVVRRHPEVTLSVDHANMPMERGEAYFARWREALRTLAEAENAVVKISGLGMTDHTWTVASIRPWVLACIEAFGADRAFFGTNWPLDRLYSSYPDVLDAYAEIVADFSESEQRALFAGNAERIFRI